jgi:hypothetical protein
VLPDLAGISRQVWEHHLARHTLGGGR